MQYSKQKDFLNCENVYNFFYFMKSIYPIKMISKKVSYVENKMKCKTEFNFMPRLMKATDFIHMQDIPLYGHRGQLKNKFTGPNKTAFNANTIQSLVNIFNKNRKENKRSKFYYQGKTNASDDGNKAFHKIVINQII